MSGGGGGSMLTEINVTPLVDVMLVLLIIFMVTAPMLQTGVDVNLPQAKAQTIPDDEGKLILTVTKDKRVFLG
jgi:biopolymer transport protein TolR